MSDAQPKTARERIDERFEQLLRVVARKAKPLGISEQEYLLGVVQGQYPPVDAKEVDAEVLN